MRYLLLSMVTVVCLASVTFAEEREVKVGFDTPTPGYKVKIVEAYRVGDELWVVSKVTSPPPGGIALTVITPISDKVTVDADEGLKVRHKVIGKTWNWGDDTETLAWVKDFATLDAALDKETSKIIWQLGGAKGATQRRDAKAVNAETAKLKASLGKWEELKQECDGNYRYFVRTSSFSGFTTETEIVVQNNKVTGRRYKETKGFGGAGPLPIAPPPEGEPVKPAPPKYKWTERFDEVGKNKEGAAAKTLDELYEEAQVVIARELPEFERRYVRFDDQGLLKSCFTVDTRIADDAPTKGVMISEIRLDDK